MISEKSQPDDVDAGENNIVDTKYDDSFTGITILKDFIDIKEENCLLIVSGGLFQNPKFN